MKARVERMERAAPLMLKLITRATSVLAKHVLPDTKMTDRRAVLTFYDIFDGPAYRKMKSALESKLVSSASRRGRRTP